jgi:hypothetical protein
MPSRRIFWTAFVCSFKALSLRATAKRSGRLSAIQVQNIFVGSGNAECKLTERQEFARLSEKLADHLLDHLRSEPVPLHTSLLTPCELLKQRGLVSLPTLLVAQQ